MGYFVTFEGVQLVQIFMLFNTAIPVNLSRLSNLSLDWGSLDDDGLRRACTSDHLASDHLKLLRIQLNWNLVDLPSGRGELLENLDSSWRSCCCAWLLHLMVWLSLLLLLLLLVLELEHLGLWLLLLLLLGLELNH